MEKYQVQITGEALSDMEGIYHYIAEKLNAPDNALKQYNRIADEILTLEIFPERYRTVDFEPEHSAGLRRMLVDHYSVFYVLRGDRVIVTDEVVSSFKESKAGDGAEDLADKMKRLILTENIKPRKK